MTGLKRDFVRGLVTVAVFMHFVVRGGHEFEHFAVHAEEKPIGGIHSAMENMEETYCRLTQ